MKEAPPLRDLILQALSQGESLSSTQISKKIESDVSRQYITRLLSQLVKNNLIVRKGKGRSTRYLMNNKGYFSKTYENIDLQEHIVISEIETHMNVFKTIPENSKSIWMYTFSEMMNNAIEHSNATLITVSVTIDEVISFTIIDNGIGVFNNIMNQRNLSSEIDAIQDLMKGKTTTMPRSHSGEGIFFTSKISEEFTLSSYSKVLKIDNTIQDIFVGEVERVEGTEVTVSFSKTIQNHLNDVFMKYTNINEESDFGFDRTHIYIELYTLGGIFISRSQGRRVTTDLHNFESIIYDFKNVEIVGQAFTDELFRVFKERYPSVEIIATNANPAVEFMIRRAGGAIV